MVPSKMAAGGYHRPCCACATTGGPAAFSSPREAFEEQVAVVGFSGEKTPRQEPPKNQLLDLCIHRGNPKDASLTILLTLWQPLLTPELANLRFSCWISNLGAARPSDVLCSPLHVSSRDRNNLPPRRPLRRAPRRGTQTQPAPCPWRPCTGQRLCLPWALGEETFSPMITTHFMWGDTVS